MRTSHSIARSLLALSLALGASACGGSMAEISREDRAREDSALLARGHHDDVVRLVGDAEGGAMDPAECPAMCMRRSRVGDLTHRICSIAEEDDHDEATRFLCEDARSRQQSMEARLGACACD